MRPYLLTLAGTCLFLILCPSAHGQTSPKASIADLQETSQEKDPIAILELGAAQSWNFSGGAATFAPNLAAKVTPIENWLELEAGVSPFYTRNSTEWDTDLLFKKPWTISRKSEFMLGVGPQWVHLRQNGKVTNSIAGEVAGDFMFWPTGRDRFGWFEPAYDYSFARSHQQSVGMMYSVIAWGIGTKQREKTRRSVQFNSLAENPLESGSRSDKTAIRKCRGQDRFHACDFLIVGSKRAQETIGKIICNPKEKSHG